MIGSWSIHGHAIVSDDDMIAGPDGLTPPSLRNDADWALFQRALDAAAVTVLGRLGHEANPNVKGRKRIVVSSSAGGVERRADAWWWNPALATAEEAFAMAAPSGGIVAMPGGRRVFDLFLGLGYDRFDLVRARGVRVQDGVPIFSGIAAGSSAEAILAGHGLALAHEQVIDRANGITLFAWHRP